MNIKKHNKTKQKKKKIYSNNNNLAKTEIS